MYLVDTSVWIDFFKASRTPAVSLLRTLLQSGSDVGLTPSILQEILQGTRDEQQFSRYQDYFQHQIIYLPADPLESAVAAARLYFVCRRRGIRVRSSNDCLIAQTSIEHGLVLLHDDEDFRRMRQVVEQLRETSG